MRNEYTYDKERVGFRKVRISVKKWLRRGVVFIIATMSMAVLYYVLFALFFSTDTERRLKAQIDMYENSCLCCKRFFGKWKKSICHGHH